jgi:hypothetical protein
MVRFLLFSALLLGITVVIHSIGTTLLARWLQYCQRRNHDRGKSAYKSWILAVTGVSLMAVHLIEMCLWALVYWDRPEIPELDGFSDALYFSVVNYTTLGYGDIVVENDTWRLMCGLEALNGILLAGWSTALLFFVVKQLWEFDEQQP